MATAEGKESRRAVWKKAFNESTKAVINTEQDLGRDPMCSLQTKDLF